MKVTPVQVAMMLLCGKELPGDPHREFDERLKTGLEMMKQATGQDFGFDLRAWHEYLTEHWGRACRPTRERWTPEWIRETRKSPEWLAAVRRLSTPSPDSTAPLKSH